MTCALCIASADRIGFLEEQVRQLRDALVPPGFRAPREWKLTAKENAVLAALVERELVTRDQMMTALYSHRDDAPEPKIIDVFVHKIRRKLPPDVVIETRWGEGWSLRPDCRARLARMRPAA